MFSIFKRKKKVMIFIDGSNLYHVLLKNCGRSDLMFSSFGKKLTGKDRGYYKVYMPEFTKENVFVQILDKNLNVIQEQKISTKFSVGYFDFDKDGIYTMKVSNISENSIILQTEFGNTHSEKMVAPGIMIVLGSVIIMLSSYLKIKNYNIEHPDENIS